ncbi:MAG: hypothetical protein AAF065_11865 [Verrucomicrobiota bacterium]
MPRESTRDILIRILTDADSSGVDQVLGDIDELGSRVEAAGRKMSIFLTAPLVGAATVGFGSLIKRGVEFNSLLEDSETAIDAVLEKFGGPEMQNAEARALAAAGGIEELKRQAKEAPGTIQGLVQGLTAISGPGLAAGLTLEQLIDLTVRFSQANSRLGLSEQQLVQESRALINGNVTLDAQLAQTLGVTNENIRASKEQGRLYEFLVEQLGPLAQAADTSTVRFSNLTDVIDQLAGKISEPVFKGLSDGALSVAEAVDRMDPEDLEQIGRAIAGLVESGVDLTTWLIELDPASRKAIAGLVALVALAGPLTQFAGLLMQTGRGAKFLAGTLPLLGSNASIAKVALSNFGGVIALFAAAGSAGYGIGTAIDNVTGFSDAIGAAAQKAAAAEGAVDALYSAQIAALRDQAREMQSAVDLEEVRNAAIQRRRVLVGQYQQELIDGNEEDARHIEGYISKVDRLLDSLSSVLDLNQQRVSQQDELNEKTELQVELLLEGVGLSMAQIERQERIVAMHEIEMKILEAKRAGNEELIKQLEQQKREQQLINQFKAAEFTDQEATIMAKERASAEAAAAEAAARRLQTTTQIGKAEEENIRKLKDGYRREDFIGLSGERGQRFFDNRGNQIAEVDAFEAPATSLPASPIGPVGPPQQQPTASPDLSPVITAVDGMKIDTAPLVAAVDSAVARLQQEIDNAASQIQQLGN